MDREPILILGDIIKNLMNISSDRIYIGNENYKLPTDTGIYIGLEQTASDGYSNTNKFIPADEGQEGAQEELTYRARESYNINIYSKDSSARSRKEEVILAFSSNFAKNKQEEFQFKLANINNSFINVSGLEGPAVISRYVINISLIAWYSIIRDTDYYDQFSNEITPDVD